MVSISLLFLLSGSPHFNQEDHLPFGETSSLIDLKTSQQGVSFTVRRTQFEEVPLDYKGFPRAVQEQTDRLVVQGKAFRESSTIKNCKAGNLVGSWRHETADDGEYFRSYRDARDERGKMSFLVATSKDTHLLPLLRDPLLLTDPSATISRARPQRSLIHLLQSGTIRERALAGDVLELSVCNPGGPTGATITVSFDRLKSLVTKIVAVDGGAEQIWSIAVTVVAEMPEPLTGLFVAELSREDIIRNHRNQTRKKTMKVEIVDLTPLPTLTKEAFVLAVPADSRVIDQRDYSSPSLVMQRALAGTSYDPTQTQARSDSASAAPSEYEAEVLRRAREADEFRLGQRIVRRPDPALRIAKRMDRSAWIAAGTSLVFLSALVAGFYWNQRRKRIRIAMVNFNK